ncbi:MAG TPA: MauE/DoxX family redox-associated membrane protein [Puia sp.]|nr:MauE/DoxX family redox-associated membrane protein [Puia sp.]
MEHTYSLSGMTCSGCEAQVQEVISKIAGVSSVKADKIAKTVVIEMNRHIETDELVDSLKDYPKYHLTNFHQPTDSKTPTVTEATMTGNSTWIKTYKPILLIFAYLLAITGISSIHSGTGWEQLWMNRFMAGFFLTFSFFKLLDLKGFAESYAMYDIVAKRWSAWGYVYAFLELFIGLALLSGMQPLFINTLTLVVMTISLAGVLQSVMNKRKIRCACLGAVFNLPMSTVTILEDGLMIAMSATMLAMQIAAN